MHQLIGLHGLARSGKDTAADYLQNYGFKKYSFADPLKECLKVLFGWNDDHVYGDLKECPDPSFQSMPTPRQMMQLLGTEFIREKVDYNFWIKRAEQFCRENYGPIVIPDVRFENEADFIIKNGGIVVKIEGGYEGMQQIQGISGHASEAGIPEHYFDRTIVNDGTLDELYTKIQKLVM